MVGGDRTIGVIVDASSVELRWSGEAERKRIRFEKRLRQKVNTH